ncbi:MAG: hypothetical protein VKJ44_07090 [Synechococcus sp.]|nr:hypothetical protein [Synechococcus sp.]
MATSSAPASRFPRVAPTRLYRLVDQQGNPHPVLDDLYESLEAAWTEALNWWQEHVGAEQPVVGIGVEVSTTSGDWRTLRHPGS